MSGLWFTGAVIALEPLPIVTYILVRATARGPRNALAFVSGWTVSLLAMLGISALLTGGSGLQRDTAPSTTTIVVQLVVGLGLLVAAFVRCRRHPRTPLAHDPPTRYPRLP